MKKLVSLMLAVALMLSVSASFAQQASGYDLDKVMAQAEEILARPLEDGVKIDEKNLMPEGLKVTGPFLYVGPEHLDVMVFMPNVSKQDYVPSGLPEGAKLFVMSNEKISAMYPKLITEEADAPVVYALLFGTGYYNETHYQNDLTLYDSGFTIAFVDYASGEIVAWTNGREYDDAPFLLYNNSFYTDENGRKVFDRDLGYIGNTWRETLLYASTDDTGAAILDGVLVSMSNKEIEEYTVPDGVTEIGESAFAGCDKLRSVTLSADVTTIGLYAFASCTQLESVTFPELESLAPRPYYIFDNAFAGCESLKSLTLPEGWESIGMSAFDGCTALDDINVPASLTYIGLYAFKGTAWLAAREGEQFITVGDGVLIKANAATDAADEAFMSAMGAAFGDMSDMTDEDKRDFEEEFGISLFADELAIPEGIKTLAEGSLSDLTVKRLVLPGTLCNYNSEAFYNLNVEEIYISDGVEMVQYGAFANCTGIKRVRVPQSVWSFSEIFYDYQPEIIDNVVIVCPEGSYAYSQAQSLGYKVEAEK